MLQGKFLVASKQFDKKKGQQMLTSAVLQGKFLVASNLACWPTLTLTLAR